MEDRVRRNMRDMLDVGTVGYTKVQVGLHEAELKSPRRYSRLSRAGKSCGSFEDLPVPPDLHAFDFG